MFQAAPPWALFSEKVAQAEFFWFESGIFIVVWNRDIYSVDMKIVIVAFGVICSQIDR